MRSRFRWRDVCIIAVAVLIGAVWAGYNLRLAGDSRDQSLFHALIWTVFATPLATFIGWVLVRPRERWSAAAVCFTIYIFSIFAAARVERLLIGAAAAATAEHALYFRLCLVFNIVAGLGVALHRASHVGTMIVNADPERRTASSRDEPSV